ncbi:hypothetical protein BJ322DRAFT_857293 [Thelephora terrestris]|uniref:Uncharacterized protein n=1 Tax=Thelephora terrestris TaxID=56493 RepID=A0A9P6HCY1_9AGAM|nr:hypothetical protein BJ322DRAFT_857293 [Thelephora terrestris]
MPSRQRNCSRPQLPGPESRLSVRPHILNRNSIEAHRRVMPEASNTALRVGHGTYRATYGRNHKRRRISFLSLQGCDCAAKDAVTISVRMRPKVESSESDSCKCSEPHTKSRIRATGKARTRAFDRLDLMGFHSCFLINSNDGGVNCRPRCQGAYGGCAPNWRSLRNTRNGFVVSSVHVGTCDHLAQSSALFKSDLAPGENDTCVATGEHG